ncbi:hypothetical protein Acsp04_43660 [Actinomadura sp. NBRC 104425]|nr:hypothetical protein Acsp04_43660 [Actinomadura sp. NBRC 104425]
MPSHPCAARRRRHREAVLGPSRPGAVSGGLPVRAVAGTILDASPHLLVLAGDRGEVRVPMTQATEVWHGGPGGPDALRPGRRAIVRTADGRGADRVWVDIVRVAGTVVACGRDAVEVDMGPHRGRVHVAVPPNVLGRVLVRHPRLEPGYLIDVICVASPDGPRAAHPGTAQPGYRADHPPAADPSAPVPEEVHGTATWFGTGDAGLAYPAVDPEGNAGGCHETPSTCVPLPYVSLGSELTVRNDCTGRAVSIPVTECGCVAARFCDRCVQCGTSPRGRVVELAPVAFAGLGGDLAVGCFNVTVGGAVPGLGG